MFKTKTGQIQEMLLAIMPHWHYWFAKPFKRLLDEGVSLEMYYCIQILRMNNDTMTMSELAMDTGMTKQQMTKIVNRLIEHSFVERVSDPDDRRIIRLKITKEALNYIDGFLDKDAAYFKEFFDDLSDDDRNELGAAFETLLKIFDSLAHDELSFGRRYGECKNRRHKKAD